MTREDAWEIAAKKRTDDNLRVAHDALLELGHEEDAKLLLWFVTRREWPIEIWWKRYKKTYWWTRAVYKRGKPVLYSNHVLSDELFGQLGRADFPEFGDKNLAIDILFRRGYTSLSKALEAFLRAYASNKRIKGQ